jgi:hypothetical protein
MGAVDLQIQVLLSSALVSFTPRLLYPRQKISAYPLGMRLMGPRTGLEDVESRKILPVSGLELRPLCRIQPLTISGSFYLLCMNNSSISEFSSGFMHMLKFTA